MPSIPAELQPFAGRRTWAATLGEVRRSVQSGAEPIFIKPIAGQAKLFNGGVVKEFRDLIQTAGLTDAIVVSCSEVVQFRSEFRGFVQRKQLIGCKHYTGSFRSSPDFQVFDRAIEAFTNAPIAYALDVGVVEDGRTLLVEINDGYSLGAYGLEEVFYARLLADRWMEMVQNRSAVT